MPEEGLRGDGSGGESNILVSRFLFFFVYLPPDIEMKVGHA